MKNAFFVFALLTMTGYVFAEVKSESDRFTGSSSIKYTSDAGLSTNYRNPNRSGGETLSLITTVSKDSSGKMSHFLFLRRIAKEWKYLNCRSIYWLVDDQPMKPVDSSFQSDVLRGVGVAEGFIVILSDSQYKKMAAAAKVEVKICNDEFSFSSLDIAGMRETLGEADADNPLPDPARL